MCCRVMTSPSMALQQPQLAGAPLRQATARARTAPRRCVTTAGVRKVNTYDESWKKVRDMCCSCTHKRVGFAQSKV